MPAEYKTAAANVHATLERFILTDGMPLVFDAARSHDAYLVDARNGDEYLDLFSFFASLPLGHNHPGLDDPRYLGRLQDAARCKPTNSDVYTPAMADFVDAFSRTLPASFGNLFFIEGGALAVENAMKVAFDWKVRKNLAAGRAELGSRIVHFVNAFHGRSGYTLSVTNGFHQDKTKYFPKFDWPRISTPGRSFPADPEATAKAEADAIAQIKQALVDHPHDVAAILIETIQGEGGDVHFRPEFFQALRDIADNDEVLLIFDEIQTGMGLTGKWWAFEHQPVVPDIFSFGKKSQVCGIAATERVNEIDSVFKVSSRINSTWGGSLVDMVRCTRYIEIIESDGLLSNATEIGGVLLAGLRHLQERFDIVSGARGQGLMCAFDLPDPATRDRAREAMGAQKMIILPSGPRSLRFRPVLDFTKAHVDEAIGRISGVLAGL